MASEREQVELAFNIELQTRKAMGEISKIDKSLKGMVRQKLELKGLDKKGVEEFRKQIGRTRTTLTQMARSMSPKHQARLSKEFKEASTSAKKLTKVVMVEGRKVQKFERKLREAKTKEEKRVIGRYISASKSKISSAKRGFARTRGKLAKRMDETGALASIEKRSQKAAQRKEGIDKLKAHDTGAEVADGFKDALSSLAGKDFLGLSKAGLKISGDIMKGIGKGSMKWGAKFAAKGAKMGGATGGAMESMGALMKGVGPLIATLSKMGPILSASAGIFAAIVKLVLDVEAAAKDMNKNLLEGASSAEFMYESGKSAGGAFQKLDKVMDQVRSDATNIAENIKWGTSPDDIIRTTNALAQQGITLKSMTQAFKNAGDSSEEAASQVKGFGDMARMSFAYARLMGVSVNELTDLQAEMFTEMGTSISGMKLEFARLTKEAAESGIATNKFFAILRGVSADLGLYTTRIGQAATMLKLLGKVMNPREAQKFMQTATQGMKQMSEEERLRMTLLAGEGKMRDIVTKDLERKTKLAYADMASYAGVSSEEVRKVVEDAQNGVAGASEKMEEMLKKVPEGQRAHFKSFLQEVKMDQNAIKKGGIMGLQEAASNLSAAGALTATKAALQRFGGGGKLRDMSGIQAFAARKSAGVSLEQFRQMAKLEAAVDDQKDEMVKLLGKRARGEDLSEGDKQMLSRMDNMKLTDEKAIKAADDADIIATMEKSDQDNLAAAAEQTDYAAKTFEATTTITDKIARVVDGIFNHLYVALKDIIKTINEFIDLVAPVFGGRKDAEAKKMDEALRHFRDEGNAANVDAILKAGAGETDVWKKKGKMMDVVGPMLDKALSGSSERDKKEYIEEKKAAKEKIVGHALVGDELTEFTKEAEESFSKLSVLGKNKTLANAIEDIAAHSDLNTEKGGLKAIGMMDTLDKSKRDKFQDSLIVQQEARQAAIDRGDKNLPQVTIQKAMSDAGFDEKDYAEFIKKAGWAMSPESLAKTLPQMGLLSNKTASGAPQASATAPTGQAASTAKSSAPGMAGVVTASAAPAAPVAPAKTEPAMFPVNGPMQTSTPDTATAKLISNQEIAEKETVSNLQDLWDALRRKGVKLDQTQLETKIKDTVEKGVLEAVRVALFEYAVYTASDPNQVLQRMQDSGLSVGGQAQEYIDEKKYKEGFVNLPAKAEGGFVASISGGLAQINPAPGEGLTSIGKGERIVPAGGEGGGAPHITVNVNGIGGQDLANLIREKVNQGVYEYKRREKFN